MRRRDGPRVVMVVVVEVVVGVMVMAARTRLASACVAVWLVEAPRSAAEVEVMASLQ